MYEELIKKLKRYAGSYYNNNPYDIPAEALEAANAIRKLTNVCVRFAEETIHQQDEIDDLKSRIKIHNQIEEMRREQEYTEYWRKKYGKSDLSFPDWDDIYFDWEEGRAELDHVKAERDYIAKYIPRECCTCKFWRPKTDNPCASTSNRPCNYRLRESWEWKGIGG